MSVYRMRFGEPEEAVPSRYAPAPLCDILEEVPEGARSIQAEISRRGVKLTMPIDPKAGIYGFGLQMKSFQQRGKKKFIRPNADPIADSGDSHAPVPFFVTTAGFGLYIDTARYATFYCGKELRPEGEGEIASAQWKKMTSDFAELYAIRETGKHTILTVEIPVCEGVDVYYITGDTVLSIVSQYNLLSGGGCMPPLWGLGCFYRCDMKFRDSQVLAMADSIRALDIPCDILGLEPGWQSAAYSSSFVWDATRFPEPEKTMRALCDRHFHVNLWEQAFVHPSSPLYASLAPHSGDYLVWGGLVPDFATPQAKEIFATYERSLADMGVSGFKLDECDGSDYTGGWTFPNCASFPSGMDGEQYHSLFGTLFCEMVEQALGKTRTLSEVRNLGSLAASHPFVLYSDLYGHKDFLTALVNAGFSGLLWAPEVRHAECAEDLLRRIQMVIFSPQALVNAFYLAEMPWQMHGCTDAVRDLFRLRMSLLPYLYTAFYDYHTTGKPPVRALVCDYQDEEAARDCADEYLFGDAMLVAPLTYPEKERDVYLPQGVWHELFTGEIYEGGVHHRVTDGIPVYVRDGSLLPWAEPVNYLTEERLQVHLRAFGDVSGAVCRLADDSDDTTDATYHLYTLRAGETGDIGRHYHITN